MASLRDIFEVDNNLGRDQLDVIDASSMGSLRRGYTAGRLGTDINANLAQESSLRAGGDLAAAEALRTQTQALQRRASIYAPQISAVEDVTGIGDVPSYIAGQIGQGAASMQDPAAVAAGLSAVGTGLSFVPNPIAKGVGFGLRNLAAPAAAYDINRRQLKGEQYGNLSEDADVMGRFTPQEIDAQASTYGNVAGLIDTALPGYVGRQLGGAALRAGARPALSQATKVPMALASEGLTELAQGEGARLQHTALNPLRDASGDMSARLNEFVGGMAGATGPVAIGAAADTAFGGVRQGLDKGAQGVQTVREAVQDGVKDAVGRAGEKVVDLKARFQAASADKGNTDLDDYNLLHGIPPADIDPASPAFTDWYRENGPKRAARVSEGLDELARGGDEQAGQILANLGAAADDLGAQDAALEAGAKHLTDRKGLDALAQEAERAAGADEAGRGGGFLDRLRGRAGGKRKLNAQEPESSAPSWTGDEYEQRKGAAMAAFDEAASRADLMGEYLASQTDAQAPRYTALGERAKPIRGLMKETGRQLADLADTWTGKDAKPTAGKFDRLRYDLNRVATRLASAYGQDAPRVLTELEGMAGPKAKALFGPLREELEAVSGPGGISRVQESQQQAYDAMLKGIDPGKQAELLRDGVDLRTPRMRQQMVGAIEAAASGRMRPQERQQLADLLGPNNLQRAIQAFAPRTAEQDAVESAYETDKASNLTTDEDGNVITSDAVTDDEGSTAFEKRQGEKLVGQRAGAAMYSMQGLKPQPDRTLSGKQRDPLQFSKTSRPRLYDLRTKDGTPEEQEKRTALVEKAKADLAKHLGDDTSWTIETRSALEDMAQREGIALQTALGPYAGNKVAPGPGTRTDPDATAERMGVNTAFVNKVLTRYRDFMRDEAERAQNSDIESVKAQARAFEARVNNVEMVLKDRLRLARRGDQAVLETSPDQREDVLRRAIMYLKNFGVVVAERATNRDPEQISADQFLSLAESGRKLHAAKDNPDKNDLLMFESKLAKPLKGGGMGVAYVRARDLAKFARDARRAQGDADKGNANERYLADLSAGLASLVASGHVEGMPRGFEDGKIPSNLRLATTTYGKMAYAKQQRAKEEAARSENDPAERRGGDARATPKNQEAVAGEQDREFNTPDTRMEADEGGRLEDEARGHLIESRAQGKQATAAPLQPPKSQLDAESTAAVRALLVKRQDELRQKRDTFIENGASAKSPRIQMMDRKLAEFDAEIAKLDEQAERRKPQPAAALKEGAAPVGKTQGRPSGAARKLNAQATQLHNELGRMGFGATHDSPIRHEGKFNWREHQGKGEGAAAFGAGTYLSTGDGVHAYYKKAFTTKVREDMNDSTITQARSPTYQVSVDIPPERLLDWDKPLSEQGPTVRLRAMKAIKDNEVEPQPRIVDGDSGPETQDMQPLDMTGKELYEALVAKLTPADERNPQKAKLKGQFAASDYLQSLGILGHVYAAANGSQGKTPNYVIYDDSKITTNFVAFSQQNPSNKISTQAEMDEARNYVAKVLGPQVKVDFKALTGYSGEWIEAQNVIEISTTPGPGTMQVAYHEALHAFFSKFAASNPQALEALKALTDDPKLLERVEALLAGHPNALAQLTDGEERLAYMYQFWAAGLLDLPTKQEGLFAAIRDFFRKVFGRITDSERAAAILEAFHQGKMSDPSAAGEVIARELARGTWTTKQMRKMDGLVAKVQSLTLPTQMVLANSDSETARNLAPKFWTNPGDEEHGDKAEGYVNAKAAVATKYVNLLSGYIKGMTDKDLTQIAEYMQAQTELADIPYAPHRAAVKDIRALLNRFYKYMREERKMDIGAIDDGKYFPRVWDMGQLLSRDNEFIDMLVAKYPNVVKDRATAERIHQALVKNHTIGTHLLPSRDDGVLSPFFANEQLREFKWMKGEDIEPFLQKDLIGTLTAYFHAGARAAEYGARFGNKGQVLASELDKVRTEMLAAGQQRFKRGEFKTADAAKEWALRRHDQVVKAVGAVEGTLGSDIGSNWRTTNTWITVYQNVRLLPLALFSSVVDPLGLIARGGTMNEAYSTFLRGVGEVFTNWKDMLSKDPKERSADKWEELAMAVGSVDAAMFSHHVADEYSSMYMSKKAKRVNDTFFRLNGMEAWNRGVRVGATQAAVNFLQRHSKLPEVHSARWLKELGLAPADMSFDQDGGLVTDKKALAALKGITITEAEQQIEKVHYAIRRWVQGAVLTPNAAQRPAWSSDPHYSMFFHLKQFSYSFHQTILKRAVAEAGYGNLTPLGSFVWYIPAMLAADITKGLLQGGGSLPSHMQGMTLGDHVMRAVNRSGILSVASIGVDAQQDIFSLAGPATEQVIDAMGQPIGRTIVDALPAKSLVAGAFR